MMNLFWGIVGALAILAPVQETSSVEEPKLSDVRSATIMSMWQVDGPFVGDGDPYTPPPGMKVTREQKYCALKRDDAHTVLTALRHSTPDTQSTSEIAADLAIGFFTDQGQQGLAIIGVAKMRGADGRLPIFLNHIPLRLAPADEAVISKIVSAAGCPLDTRQ